MQFINRGVLSVMGSLMMVLSPVSLQANSGQCQQWTQTAAQAYNVKNETILQNLHTKIRVSNCSSRDKYYVSLSFSRAMYENMKKARVMGQAKAQGFAKILQITPYFWPILIDKGDEAYAAHQYDRAAGLYHQALAAIDNTTHTPDRFAPTHAAITTLYEKQDRALLAGNSFIPPVSRSGDEFKSRGVVIRSRNIPIHFGYNKSTLVANDLRHALRLLKMLRKQGQPNITLIGHTDPKGAATYNQTLSENRAKTVKDFLLKKGYKGRITSMGRGESRPLKDPRTNPERHYGQKIWHKMLRRVEVVNR